MATKNKELLGELKEARKGQQIDPAVVERLETQIDTLKQELTTANGLTKTANANAEKATKQLESETKFTQKLLVDNGLSDVLVKAGVSNPAHLKAVKSMLASQVQIVSEGDLRVAKVGDKALTDYVTEWAKSEEGKNFIAAPNNNGVNFSDSLIFILPIDGPSSFLARMYKSQMQHFPDVKTLASCDQRWKPR